MVGGQGGGCSWGIGGYRIKTHSLLRVWSEEIFEGTFP